ncbi:MAG TPA: hypothetical protein VGW33_01290 [Terriglobia bacterium]|nr:hypothetical protein [Terriglobia bacterium]
MLRRLSALMWVPLAVALSAYGLPQDPAVNTSGNATAGTIPVWNTSTDIENSSLSQDTATAPNVTNANSLFVKGPGPWFDAVGWGLKIDALQNTNGTVGGSTVTISGNPQFNSTLDPGKLIGISGAGFTAPTEGAPTASGTGSTLPAATYYSEVTCAIGTAVMSGNPTLASEGVASGEQSVGTTSGQNLNIPAPTACAHNSVTATYYGVYVSSASGAEQFVPASQGVVNTSGTAVTWVSGLPFNPGWSGNITINGTSYGISAVNSPTTLTLNNPGAGNQMSVGYNFNNPMACTPGAGPLANYCQISAGTAVISAPLPVDGVGPPLQAEWRTTISSTTATVATLTDKSPATTGSNAVVSWGTNNDSAWNTLIGALPVGGGTTGASPGATILFPANGTVSGSVTSTGRMMTGGGLGVPVANVRLVAGGNRGFSTTGSYMSGIGTSTTKPSFAIVGNGRNALLSVAANGFSADNIAFEDVAGGVKSGAGTYGAAWGGLLLEQVIGFELNRVTGTNFTGSHYAFGLEAEGTGTAVNQIDTVSGFLCNVCYYGIWGPKQNSDWLITRAILSGPGDDTNGGGAIGVNFQGGGNAAQTDTIFVSDSTIRNYANSGVTLFDCKGCQVKGVRWEDVNAGAGNATPSMAVVALDGTSGSGSKCANDIVRDIEASSANGTTTVISQTANCSNNSLGPVAGSNITTPIQDLSASSVSFTPNGTNLQVYDATSQTVNLGPVTLFSPAFGGTLMVAAYIVCRVGHSGSTIGLTINWNDGVHAQSSTIIPTSSCATTSTFYQAQAPVWVAASQSLSFSTTASFGMGGSYDIHLRVF